MHRPRADTDKSPDGESEVSSSRIEILYIIDYFHRTGGTEKYLAQLIAGLPADQFRCSVVAFDIGVNPLLDGLRTRGVPIISLPVGREYVPRAALQAWRLARLIRAKRYDIVQTMHQKADSYGAVIAWLAGCRHLVCSKRDTGALRKPWHFFVNRRLRSLFEACIVVADAVRAAVLANDRIAPDRIVTIYNGVDTTRFSPPDAGQRASARARLGFGAEDFVVGMVAGFRPEKNHDTFFAGVQRALPNIAPLKVLAVGAGPTLARWREQIAGTELSSRTVFTGDVADVVSCLWAMDVGCLTPGSNEGFSNAVIEQMAVGLPMIATAVGGNEEALQNGESGHIIAPGDEVALARTLTSLYVEPLRRGAMGRAARRRVEEKFSLAHMCTAHALLYRSLCGRPAVVHGTDRD